MAKRRTRKFRSMLTGVVVLVVFALALQLALTADQGLPGATYTLVDADVSDVGALRPGDDVRVASVRVGQVKDVRLVDGTPRVTLQLDGTREIYRDAAAEAKTVTVASRSALGQKYVSLTPGTPGAGKLGPADVIPSKRTAGTQELSELLDVLDAPTRNALGSTVREVGGGSGGHAQDLQDALKAAPEILPDLATVSKALSVGDGADLTALLTAADRLSTRFAGRQQQLSDLLGRLDTTMRAVAVDDGKPLDDVIGRAPSTLQAARSGLQSLQAPLKDLHTGMSQLVPGARALGQATSDLRGVLREAVPPLGKVPDVGKQAEPALSDLTKTVADARPLAPRLTHTFASADKFLRVLAPYAPEVSGWFTNWAAALSHGDENGHFLRLYLLFSEESVLGQGGVRDPLVARNPYPAPGEAAQDARKIPGGNR
ncbi:MlaD family protein [Amycolatopsis palatopharyngis]|uniref:MlaD family protein n=1 Tax=Amycolatopsis palatopharyngis TaxID=187982 RepID=UPI000E229E11|nr:MlaD family protein [Amycolatopsis palatopharyngis]